MQQPAPIVHRNLKPKLSHDDTESKLIAPSKLRSGTTVKSALNQPVVDLKPPCIDDIRKLKPTTPIKVSVTFQFIGWAFIKPHHFNPYSWKLVR